MVAFLASACVLLIAGAASAIPIGSPSPISGFGGDSGVETFEPAASVTSFELLDLFDGDPNALSLFGFYYAGSPGSETIIFSFDDAVGSVASIDFNAGTVTDLGELGAPQPPEVDSFTVASAPTGFFFGFNPNVAGGGAAVIVYSESALNGGDFVGTYQSDSDPSSWLITAEFGGNVYAVEAVQGIGASAIPEPSSAVLFLVGGVAIARGIRRRG